LTTTVAQAHETAKPATVRSCLKKRDQRANSVVDSVWDACGTLSPRVLRRPQGRRPRGPRGTPPPYPLRRNARGWFDPLPTGGGGSVVDENARNTLSPSFLPRGKTAVRDGKAGFWTLKLFFWIEARRRRKPLVFQFMRCG